jgi:hypothetical protein
LTFGPFNLTATKKKLEVEHEAERLPHMSMIEQHTCRVNALFNCSSMPVMIDR